jgi:hypothetical protein
MYIGDLLATNRFKNGELQFDVQTHASKENGALKND